MSVEEQATENVEVRAERIAAGASDVRERTRIAFVDAVRNREMNLRRLDEIAQQMMHGAVEGVKRLAPDDRESVLRQVIDGLADGVSTTANAARYAFDEARGRGEQFAREDVDRIVDNLRDLQERFVDVVSDAAHRAGSQIGVQAGTLRDHLRRAYESARPAVESATRAAVNHPVKFAEESVTTGAQALPRVVGTVLHALSGALEGAGDLITGAESASPAGARKPASKKSGKQSKKAAAKKRKKSAGTKSSKQKARKKTKKKTRKKTGTKSTGGKKSAARRKSGKKKAGRKKSIRKKTAKKKASRKKPAAKKRSKKKKSGKKKSSRASFASRRGRKKSKSKKKRKSSR